MEKKGGKEEMFTVLGGKNMIFEKKGGAKNINYFDNIHPWGTRDMSPPGKSHATPLYNNNHT